MSIRKAPDAIEARVNGQVLVPLELLDKWLPYLPVRLLKFMLALSQVATDDLRGAAMWATLEKEAAPIVQRVASDPEEVAAEREIAELYGQPLPSTVAGMVDVLVHLGLVVRQGAGEDEILDIPELLPDPKGLLKLV